MTEELTMWKIEDEIENRGIEKGIEIERLKNARGMKAAGIAPELIAQITGLSPEEIQEL